MKQLITFLVVLTALALAAGCSQAPSYEKLKDVKIVVDGSPQEWADFPVVHEDPKGDNISIEYDISTVKAFANNDTQTMYLLIESYIPSKDLTSLELDLEYNGETYRLGFLPEPDVPAVLARKTGDDKWEVVKNVFGVQFASADAVELSFPIEEFPSTNNLKIAGLRVMGGVCCQQYEYYAIDFIEPGQKIDR